MRLLPFVYSLVVTAVLFVVVAVAVGFQMQSGEKATGLYALVSIAANPMFWALYVVGFGLTYWLTARF